MLPKLKSNLLEEIILIALNYFLYLHPQFAPKNHSSLFRSNPIIWSIF
jgi:hypothetical protein